MEVEILHTQHGDKKRSYDTSLFHIAAKAFATRYGWQDADYSVVDGVNRHES